MTPNQVPPPDLEIRIRTADNFGRVQLTYVLHSPNGAAPFSHVEIAGPTLQASTEEIHRLFLQQIEALGSGLDAGGALLLRADVNRKLVSLGRDFWRQLFNEEMRQAYRSFRSSVRSLLIISDEPWIPWEMVKPYDDAGDLLDDPFLAERFEITRWLSSKRPLSGSIEVYELACITGAHDLPLASQEKNLLIRLTEERSGLEDVTPSVSSVNALTSLFEEGGLGLVHFAQHGTFDPAMPNEAGLPLADGSVFRPSDLHGPIQTQIAEDRPLIVLNACESGRQAWTWTGLGGWADRWVRVCGCGAFIGPLWRVRDSAAFAFARALYDSLERGKTLGRAAWEARRAAQEATPGDPSWLAYVVYGHPNARVQFGDKVREDQSSVPRGTVATSKEEFFKGPLKRKTFEQFVTDVERARQERGLSDLNPSIPPSQPLQGGPFASTNLRIKKNFSDLERDQFVEDAFKLMASFFENSLNQLELQNRSMTATRFRRIDRDHFSAAIYVHGEKRSACRVWLPRDKMGDIAYFGDDSGADNTYNEILWAENDGYSMWLRPGFQIFSSGKERLSPQEAAEYLWSMLMGKLQ